MECDADAMWVMQLSLFAHEAEAVPQSWAKAGSDVDGQLEQELWIELRMTLEEEETIADYTSPLCSYVRHS